MSYITKSVHKMILAMAAIVVALPSVVAAAPVGNENTEPSYTWSKYGDHGYALTSTRTYWVDNEAEAVRPAGIWLRLRRKPRTHGLRRHSPTPIASVMMGTAQVLGV